MSANELQGGYVLVAVSLALALVAVSAYLLTRESGMELELASSALRKQRAHYAAEAGFRHELWRVRAANCSGYTPLASTPFGAATYSASVAPSAGSPVAIAAIATLPDGTTAEYRDDSAEILTPPTTSTATLQPGAAGKDTYLDFDLNGENFGGHADLGVDTGISERRALLHFDLSFLPAGATIQSAELRLYLEGNSKGSAVVIRAHRVTSAWVEGTQVGAGIDGASWDDRDVGVAWTMQGGDFEPSVAASASVEATPGWRSWDLTTLVRGWTAASYPNYGVLLETPVSVETLWFSAGDDPEPSKHPILEITYTSPGGPCPTAPHLLLSVRDNATLGGLGFADEDVADYDAVTNTATLLFDGSARFSGDEDVDAVHVRPNGHLVLSTETGATLGGLSFADEDLVDYDPVANTATLLFDGSARFSGDEDVDAVHVRPNGHLVLSTETGATLGGLSFADEDLVDYDPVANTATLLFDGSARFSGDEDVDAVHVLANGHLVLSVMDDATLGGLSFANEDLVDFDPVANTATLFFDGSARFSADEDVDAVHIE